jgi:hypothetical protein
VGSEFWALTQRPKKETSVNRSPSFGQWDIWVKVTKSLIVDF